MDVLVQIFGWTITIALSLFVIISIVLFIRDDILAKREGRSIKKKFTVMFIISMAIIAVVTVIVILLCLLAMLVMRSM